MELRVVAAFVVLRMLCRKLELLVAKPSRGWKAINRLSSESRTRLSVTVLWSATRSKTNSCLSHLAALSQHSEEIALPPRVIIEAVLDRGGR